MLQGFVMPDSEHIQWLREGVDAWNERRKRDEFVPDLENADVSSMFGRDGFADSPASEISKLYLGHDGHVNLSGINLSGAKLRGAVLNGVNLSNANLRCADLKGCELNGATFDDADLDFADLRDAKCRGYADFKRAKLCSARLNSADFSGADLQNTILAEARIGDANLCSANLVGANLSRTRLWERGPVLEPTAVGTLDGNRAIPTSAASMCFLTRAAR